MNGAESLIKTALGAGVNVCFANPGTSEMELVRAMDHAPEMRCVLGLFEGVCTGAADGYGRLAGKPALTLLHLGPGFSNGLANLHNARRARTPIVNIIGDMASWHQSADAPLSTDIESLAKPVSGWVKRVQKAQDMPKAMADAIEAAMNPPGQVATLIVANDACWDEAPDPVEVKMPGAPSPVDHGAVEKAAKLLQENKPGIILVGDDGCRERALNAAQRVASATGARVVTETFVSVFDRGEGVGMAERMPYLPRMIQNFLQSTKSIVLAGSREPVSFFGYPNVPSILTPEAAKTLTLASPGEDIAGALEALAEAVGAAPDAGKRGPAAKGGARPSGPVNLMTMGQGIAAVMPENAIVMEEALTSADSFYAFTQSAPRHTVLHLTGGAIGLGIPASVGAAVACPDRKVISLQADGSGMYTLQGLWTQAREKLDVTTVLYSNRSYKILQLELMQMGVTERGPQAEHLTDLGHPDLNWTKLAEGLGVPAERAETAEAFTEALERGLNEPGPYLVEAVI